MSRSQDPSPDRSHHDESLQEAIDDWLNGTLDDAKFRKLEERLLADRTARDRFRKATLLDAGLRDSAAGEALGTGWRLLEGSGSGATSRVQRRAPAAAWLAPWIAAAAILVIGLSLMSPFFQGEPRVVEAPPPPEAMAEGYAILTRVSGVEWAEGSSRQWRQGDILPAGHLHLLSGVAQIEFFSGATVVVEGKADFEIRSAAEAFCHAGKVRANVPPAARGFRILTPQMDVVDLGTEFAVSVGEDGAQVHVFDGEVEIVERDTASGRDPRGLEAGSALAILPDGRERPLAAETSRFLGVADLDDRTATRGVRTLERWQTHSSTLRRDPRLIAYYPFDQRGDWNRVLANSAVAGGSERDGAIVGATRVRGRWDFAKSALEFKPTGSRVRVFLPGEYGSLTIACWARIDSLDRKYNALYLADSYEPGEPHWQIERDGRLMYSMRIRDEGQPQNHIYYSPPIWDLSQSGRWMHLAVTFDVDRQVVVQYVNGEEVSRERAPADAEVHRTRLGAGEIGNWGLPLKNEAWFAIRNLNGAIDEFAIFADALAGEEIFSIYQAGNPES